MKLSEKAQRQGKRAWRRIAVCTGLFAVFGAVGGVMAYYGHWLG